MPDGCACRVDAAADGRALLDAFGAAGSLTSFSFTPPDLSEVFLEAVGPAAANGQPDE